MNITPSPLPADGKIRILSGDDGQDPAAVCNQVILRGCVEGYDKVKRFRSRNGRMISFSLKTCNHIGIHKQSHTEFHRVVIQDGVVGNSVLECNSLIVPGRWLQVYGVLRHRYLVDKLLRSTEITEIHALSISPADPVEEQQLFEDGDAKSHA